MAMDKYFGFLIDYKRWNGQQIVFLDATKTRSEFLQELNGASSHQNQCNKETECFYDVAG